MVDFVNAATKPAWLNNSEFPGPIPKVKAEVPSKVFGMSSVNGTLSASAFSWGLKQTAESAYTGARIVVFIHGASNVEISCLLAATETASVADATVSSLPIVAAAPVTTVDDVSGSGWQTAKFGGNLTVTAAGTGTFDLPEILVSDLIPLSSIARADGGALPLILARVDLATIDAGVSFTATADVLMRTPSVGNKDRIVQSMSQFGPKTPSQTVDLSDNSVTIGFVFEYATPGFSVMAIGDSTFQNETLLADNLSSWGYRGAATASEALGVPVNFINQGASGRDSDMFIPAGKASALAMNSNILVLEGWSPNDYAPGSIESVIQAAADSMIAKIEDMVTFAEVNGKYLIVSTAIPNAATLNTVAKDAVRLAHNATLRAKAAAGDFYLLDKDSLLTDGAAPADILSFFQFPDDISPDGVHPNTDGVGGLSALFAGVMMSIGFDSGIIHN